MVSEEQAGHTLGHKASLTTHRKAEVVSWILSDHDAIKLEINIVILKMLMGGGAAAEFLMTGGHAADSRQRQARISRPIDTKNSYKTFIEGERQRHMCMPSEQKGKKGMRWWWEGQR